MSSSQVPLSRPIDVDTKPPEWLSQIAPGLRRVSPKEGWDTFLLMFATVSVAAWIVREANFVPTPGLILLIFLASLTAMLMAKVRGAIWPIPYSVGLLIGLIVVTWQTASLVEGQTQLGGMTEVWSRIRIWYDVAVTGGISRDLLPSTLFLLSLAWLLGYVSSWFLFKWSNVWVGLLLSGVSTLTTLSFLPGLESRFFFFIFLAMLLVARISLVQRELLWEKLEIGSITKIRSRFLSAPIILSISTIILIVSAAAPSRTYVARTAVDLWNWGREPLTNFEDDFARLFSGISSKKDVNGRFFGTTLPFQGKISFGGDIVMVANANQPTYWLSRSYSEYSSEGWIAGDTVKLNVGPEALPPPPHESDNRALAFQRVQLTFDSDELFVGGNVDWVSHDAIVETLEPKVFEIDIKSSALDSQFPSDIQEFASNLRRLLDPPPNRFVESLISQVLPDDLIVLSVEPGSESERWRDQRRVTLRRKDPEIPEVVNWQFKRTLAREAPYTLYAFVSKATNNELRKAPVSYPGFLTDHYLQLPDTLPNRVRDLAERITAGAITPLDKAMAIENYLRNEGGFEYSQDIDRPPRSADGVDWFLFETKTGYSDYFASSMTVMLRAVDVPARMAAGYAPGELDLTGRWTIKDEDSHGWTQVYFPGHGWVDFEPTSAWPAIDRGAGDEALDGLGAEEKEDPLANFDDLTGAGFDADLDECELLRGQDVDEAELLGCDEEQLPLSDLASVQAGWNPTVLAVPTAIVLGIIALVWTLGWLIWNYGLGKADPAERYYIKMGRLGSLAGIRRRSYETPMDYAFAIGDAVPTASAGAQEVAWNFAIGKYAHKEPTSEIIAGLNQQWKHIRNGLLARTLKRILPVGGNRIQ